MAGTSISPQHSMVQTYQRPGLILQAELRALSMLLIGEDGDSIIVAEPSTGSKRGATEKVRFQPWNTSPMPTGMGVQSYGNEGGDAQFEDSYAVDYLRLGSRALEGEIRDQGFVEWSLRDSAETGMMHDAAHIMECSIIHQLAGYSPVNDLTAGGPNGTGYSSGTTNYTLSLCNACTEPDTAHHFFAPNSAGAASANEAAVAADSSCVITDRFVNKCLRKLRSDRYSALYPLAPASTPWGKGYVCLMSSAGMEQIKEQSSDSDIFTLAQACIEGGMDPENSTLWTNEGFKIKDVFYLASDFITTGTTGSSAGSTTAGEFLANTERALLLGARAAHIRFGEGFSRDMWLAYKDTVWERRLSMFVDTVIGMKATIVNSQRWGSAVITHYSDVSTARYS